MIHEPTAIRKIKDTFGTEPFPASEAISKLGYSTGSTFVALSQLTKSGKLRRIKKSLYVLDEPHIPENRDNSKLVHNSTNLMSMMLPVRKPELLLPPKAYVTGTYALSTALSPYSSVKYLDVFVRPENYARTEDKGFQPTPLFYPLAQNNVTTYESEDGYRVANPKQALIDLIKLVRYRARDVSLEYEIVPYLVQMSADFDTMFKIAAKENLLKHLSAIVLYVMLVAKRVPIDGIFSSYAIFRISTKGAYNIPSVKFPEVLPFVGGTISDVSLEVFERTGVVIEANEQQTIAVLRNL